MTIIDRIRRFQRRRQENRKPIALELVALPETPAVALDAVPASATPADRDWKEEIARINKLCEKRKREMQITQGGRIVENDLIETNSTN
jgi:hypothetical protein